MHAWISCIEMTMAQNVGPSAKRGIRFMRLQWPMRRLLDMGVLVIWEMAGCKTCFFGF